jgi:hypothetical protein
MDDEIKQWLYSEKTVDMLARTFREIGITPPPYEVNTGHVLARMVLTRLVALREENVISKSSKA